jgi:hypothetical protein
MSKTERDTMLAMLRSFIDDPPDTEHQIGFLGAVLTIGNEVLGIPRNDPVWEQAFRLWMGARPAAPSTPSAAASR